MESKVEWLIYVAIAGLAWGTYVPLISYGGGEFVVSKGYGGRLMAILCVGVAYFVIGVMFPLILFFTKQAEWPQLKTTALVFSGLAGVAGAAGALCVVFATVAARRAGVSPLYIAPLIFGLAPVINTLVSLVWEPLKDNPLNFGFRAPNPLLYLGIVLVGVGAALVLYAKPAEGTPPPAHNKSALSVKQDTAGGDVKPGDAISTGMH